MLDATDKSLAREDKDVVAPRLEFVASQSSLYACKAVAILCREGVMIIASESFELEMCDKDRCIGAEG